MSLELPRDVIYVIMSKIKDYHDFAACQLGNSSLNKIISLY